MCEVVTFFDKKRDYRCLSNFWECKVSIVDNGVERVYNSGELCFHGEKFVRLSKICKDEERKKKLFEYGMRFVDGGDILSSRDAKSKGGKGKNGFRLNSEELREWYKMSMEVQMEICRYKLDNYEEVREWLDKSRGCMLIHSIGRIGNEKMKERIWEGRLVKKEDGSFEILGGNKLGEMWMKFRL
jgi:hypothetical protein